MTLHQARDESIESGTAFGETLASLRRLLAETAICMRLACRRAFTLSVHNPLNASAGPCNKVLRKPSASFFAPFVMAPSAAFVAMAVIGSIVPPGCGLTVFAHIVRLKKASIHRNDRARRVAQSWPCGLTITVRSDILPQTRPRAVKWQGNLISGAANTGRVCGCWGSDGGSDESAWMRYSVGNPISE